MLLVLHTHTITHLVIQQSDWFALSDYDFMFITLGIEY